MLKRTSHLLKSLTSHPIFFASFDTTKDYFKILGVEKSAT